jgi:hypothetical protein
MRLTGSTPVTASLRPDPGSRILVPIVTAVCDGAEARLNVVPSLFVLEATTDDLGHKSASSPLPRSSVEFGDEIVLEPNV